jgi:type VI protein secretion system component Hcp
VSRAFVLFAFLAVLLAVGADVRPLPAQSTATWSLQGILTHEAIPVTGFAWDSTADVGRFAEYTPAAGVPTGKRQHKPFTITMQLDRTSQTLWQAVVDGTPLGNIEVWKEDDGARTHVYTLQNAMISSYSVSRGGGGGGGVTESISFVYEQIILHASPAAGGRSGR